MLAAACILSLGLAACSSDSDETASSPFTQALQKDYSDLSAQASALPAEPSTETSFWDSIDPFSSSSSSSDVLAKDFSTRADLANAGTEPDPEAANAPAHATLRPRLLPA